MDKLPELNKEPIAEKPIGLEKLDKVPNVVDETQENIRAGLEVISGDIKTREAAIVNTAARVNEIRHSLGLESEETDIPSVVLNRKSISELKGRQRELENQLKYLLSFDRSADFIDYINEVKNSKIDWSNSPEFERRLKAKGVSDEDIKNIKVWLRENVVNTKTFLLPPNRYLDALYILKEMSVVSNSNTTNMPYGFYVNQAPQDSGIKNSVILPLVPSMAPGYEGVFGVDPTDLHHELGHAADGGILNHVYKDTKLPVRPDLPASDYIGQTIETDTRIRSMFRDLDGLFDPHSEKFNQTHLEELKERSKEGSISTDTYDLLEHYDDDQLIEIANTMPAI